MTRKLLSLAAVVVAVVGLAMSSADVEAGNGCCKQRCCKTKCCKTKCCNSGCGHSCCQRSSCCAPAPTCCAPAPSCCAPSSGSGDMAPPVPADTPAPAPKA